MQLAGVQLLDVLGKDEDRQSGHLCAGGDGGLQALILEGRGQPYVHHGDIWTMLEQRGQQRGPVVDRRNDLAVERREQASQPVAEEGEVLGDDNAHGSSMVTTVGPPGGLDTAILPSKAASLRSIPRRPEPADGSAPPRPLSPTWMASRPS